MSVVRPHMRLQDRTHTATANAQPATLARLPCQRSAGLPPAVQRRCPASAGPASEPAGAATRPRPTGARAAPAQPVLPLSIVACQGPARAPRPG